jgi:hypothetical protein
MLSHYTATAADVFSAAVASLIAAFRKTNGGMGRADCNKQTYTGQILKYNVGGAIISQIEIKPVLCAILFIVFHIDISGKGKAIPLQGLDRP